MQNLLEDLLLAFWGQQDNQVIIACYQGDVSPGTQTRPVMGTSKAAT